MAELVKGSFLEDAPMIEVSSTTREVVSTTRGPRCWTAATWRSTDAGCSLEGRNLLDEYYVAYLGRNDMLAGFETWGRSYLLGASAKF